jgi:ribonuclease P protein component
MNRMKRRQDFLAAAKGMSVSMPGLVLQGRERGDALSARVGFTCSKKIGNAVARNRAKRRLREAARLSLALVARAGYDYVLIGRLATAGRRFDDLKQDLQVAVSRLHEGRGRTARAGQL